MTDANNLRGATTVVVGGGGFLGAHLCPKLVALGADVRVYGRTRYFEEPLRGVTQLAGALSDLEKLASALEGADVVFHLAGSSAPAGAEAGRVRDMVGTIGGTLELLDICRHSGIERVVFASSGGTVYGAGASPPFTERTLPSPISTYGINKLAAEHYLALYNRSYGMRNLSLRISNPFGEFQHGLKNQGAVSVFARRALAGSPITIWGDGSVERDFLYAADVAGAMIAAALYQGPYEVFNVGSGIGRSLLDVIVSLEHLLERPIEVHHDHSRPIDVPISVLDCKLAGGELGWSSSSDWEQALRRTCDWIVGDLRPEHPDGVSAADGH